MITDLKKERQDWLDAGFQVRFRKTKVEDGLETPEVVKALEDLLDDAGKQKASQEVLNLITLKLELTKIAAKQNAADAAEKTRVAEFHRAADHAKSLLAGDDDGKTDAAIKAAVELAVRQEELDEVKGLTKQHADKKGVKATAEQKKANLKAAIEEATVHLTHDEFEKARRSLAEADVAGLDEDSARNLKAMKDKIDQRELLSKYDRAIAEAKAKEKTDPAGAAASYREAARFAASEAIGDAARSQAVKLEAQVAEARLQEAYNGRMDSARKAMDQHEWRAAEAEADKALELRKNDKDALKLRDDARAARARATDPARPLSYVFKAVVKGPKWAQAWSVAADAAGNVYALDRDARHMYVIDRDLKVARDVTLAFEFPDRVFVDAKGRIWGTEWGSRSKICILEPQTFASTKSFGVYGGAEDGKFNCLLDMVVSPDGTMVYGLDQKNYRLQTFDVASGAFKMKAGERYSGKNGPVAVFRTPRNLSIDKEGRVYASDKDMHTIQRFKPDGTFDSVWKTFPANSSPGAMVWADNKLYLLDTGLWQVQVFAPDGTQLGSFGSYGKGDSQFYSMQGVAVTPDGKVYVADGGTRIEVFEEVK